MTDELTGRDARYDRRTVMKAGLAAASTAAVGAAPAGASGGSASASAEASLEDWLKNVGNFDGIVDERGKSTVTVEVGAKGNDGAYAFGPAVVRVDPGTTVVFEWTGEGSPHNVVAEDGSYESEMQGDEGATFEQSFDSAGVSRYYCGPHKPMGMKGAVVVGDVEVAVPSTDGAASDAESGSGAGGDSIDYDGWFENVANFDGTVDRTGESEVTITVGAEGNNGAYAFGPAAVQVDPGTTVTWEWTGAGGSHNVVAEDGSYESEMQGSDGDTYERTFDSAGISKYYCGPHKQMGMKGAVVVGSPNAAASQEGDGAADGGDDLWLYGLAAGLVGALLSPLLFGAFLRTKDDVTERSEPPQGHRSH
ncbi:halocyanin domain-containing protein [Halorubellus salinus]|uniref:halocyanin domain-containing protein n=1 Tax=Halorubellus salinus TaxID=755309 RepID=UPI001D079028|nr:halocyanin domain-containing protein [Halorubellus salinus]